MSREADLYKDKIEVSLDGRQIFYLFFGGAVIVGLVFVLGVMVGRRVEARGHTDRARNAATVDPLAALDRLEGGNGLSFQGALRGAEGPATDVEKKIADQASGPRPQPSVGHQAAGDAQPKADKKAEAPKPEAPKPEAIKDEPKKSEPKADAKATEQKKDDAAKSEGAKKDEAKKTDVKPEIAKKDDAKSETAKKDDAKKTDAKTETAKATDKPAKFALQLASFQDKAEAQAFLDSIKGSGVQAYMSEGSVDGKQYFRIRTGSYTTVDAANDAKADVQRATKKTAIAIRL